jgi:hypothetical protein
MADKMIWAIAVIGLAGVGLVGCDKKEDAKTTRVTEMTTVDGVSVMKVETHTHVHEHTAKHSGTLVELGGEFAHVELVVDGQTGKITAYAMDAEVEKSERLKQEKIGLLVNGKAVELSAVANELTGEKVGDTSEFTGQADMLKGLKAFDGVIVEITVRGRTFKNVAFKFPQGNDDHAGHGH